MVTIPRYELVPRSTYLDRCSKSLVRVQASVLHDLYPCDFSRCESFYSLNHEIARVRKCDDDNKIATPGYPRAGTGCRPTWLLSLAMWGWRNSRRARRGCPPWQSASHNTATLSTK